MLHPLSSKSKSNCPFRKLEIKHGEVIVWCRYFSHILLNWLFMKRNGKCHGSCPLLPSFSTPSPKDKPLPVGLPSPGASGKTFQSTGHCRAEHQRERERDRDTVCVLDPNHSAVLPCLQQLSSALSS